MTETNPDQISQATAFFNDTKTMRSVTIMTSLLFVPAFMFGVVSIWSVLFALCLGLLFRASLIGLNKDIEAVQDLKEIFYRWRFLGICVEGVVYLCLAFGLFYAVYGTGYWAWPKFEDYRLDQSIMFFKTLSFISFYELADPRQNPVLYLISSANILAHFVFVSLCIVGFRCFLNFGKLVFYPIMQGRSSVELAKKVKFSEWLQGRNVVLVFCFLIFTLRLYYIYNLENIYSLYLEEKILSASNTLWFILNTPIVPYITSFLIIIVFIRIFESFIGLGKKYHV